MIVITAATGNLGRLVIQRLLEFKTASEIAAVVRNPEKARDLAQRGIEVRVGDYNDVDSLRPAFADADHLLFISSPEIDNEIRIAQHNNVIEAAREALVGHIAYTSYLGAALDLPGPMHVHYATERALEQSGLPYTFLRNPIYTEALLPPVFLRTAIQIGELKVASKGRKVNSATRPDLADAAAAVVSSDGHEGNAYHLTGPLWSYAELARVLSRISGREIAYLEVPLVEMGPYFWVFELISAGMLEEFTTDLERLMEHPAMRMQEYVEMTLRAGPVE